MLRSSLTRIVTCCSLFGLLVSGVHREVCGQSPRPEYRYPIWQPTMPPGFAGEMGAMRDRCNGYFQQLQVVLPSTGDVTFYAAGAESTPQSNPGQAGFLVGPVYRFKISGMPEFPGEELYPSIELLDRLHPPANQSRAFPVPIAFSEEEIERAIGGSMVTKVVYLEQPDIAVPMKLSHGQTFLPAQPMEETRHLLRKADLLGRPMVLVRLGGRVASPQELASSAPIDLTPPTPEQAARNKAHQKSSVVESRTITVETEQWIIQTAHDPRLPALECPPGVPEGFVAGPVCEDWHALSARYPDEYLFDGGDRSVSDRFVGEPPKDIDTEDTIAEFKDATGKRRIKKSNRVAIYSPRFGSISNQTVSSERKLVNGPVNTTTLAVNDGLRQGMGLKLNSQRTVNGRVLVRSRVSGVGGQEAQSSVSQKEKQSVAAETQNTYESVQRDKTSQATQKQQPLIQGARAVTDIAQLAQYPIASGTEVSLGEVYAKTESGEIVGSYSLDKRGNLRIDKKADRTFAKPGDIITFTITIRNVGDLPIQEVLVLDNLTPRLEFIPESMKTDLPVQFSTEENDEGSHLLRWTFTESLKGKFEGTISFEVRVR